MKIGMNARHLYADGLRGWNRYTANLVQALAQLGESLVLYTEKPIADIHRQRWSGLRVQERVSGEMFYPWWEQRWLHNAIIEDDLDVFHCPIHFGLPSLTGMPMVLTLLDCIDDEEASLSPLNLSAWKSRSYRWLARNSATRIITVSRYSQDQLFQRHGVEPAKIQVIPEAADPVFCQPLDAEAQASYLQEREINVPYFLYVGGWEKRKNVEFLVTAFAEANLDKTLLVLAGGSEGQRAEMRAMAKALGVTDRVRLLPWVEDVAMPLLYAGALAFVNPSLREGFGLQAVEAMQAGTPVLAADATSLPEVVGTGGALFDPIEPLELIVLMRRLREGEGYREELRMNAKRRASDFSWEQTARHTLEVYREAIQVVKTRS